jgi:DeoR family glycerol-3-phosphate regulon repressor
VADHTKLSRTAPARIASLAEVDMLITDRPLPAPLAAACADWGTRVCVATD